MTFTEAEVVRKQWLKLKYNLYDGMRITHLAILPESESDQNSINQFARTYLLKDNTYFLHKDLPPYEVLIFFDVKEPLPVNINVFTMLLSEYVKNIDLNGLW